MIKEVIVGEIQNYVLDYVLDDNPIVESLNAATKAVGVTEGLMGFLGGKFKGSEDDEKPKVAEKPHLKGSDQENNVTTAEVIKMQKINADKNQAWSPPIGAITNPKSATASITASKPQKAQTQKVAKVPVPVPTREKWTGE